MSDLAKTSEARAAAWRAWGTLDDDLLTHLINPALMGGPRWPALREAFRVARNAGQTLVASDGLSDPFDDGPKDENGFGLEIYAISADPLEKIAGSWLWDAVWQMSQFAAKHGGIGPLLDELRYLSTELYDVGIPEPHTGRFVNDAGRVGVLLGLDQAPLPAHIAGPLSNIRLVSLKLLTLEELDFVAEAGERVETPRL
jgi:hypothetical protein